MNTLPDRTKENRPPSAVDDQFGVRPGRTTLLPVLDNDSDPDGDVLTAQVQGDNARRRNRAGVYDGTGLQVKVPADATGTAQFQYQANDGRGGTAGAKVTLTVKDPASNEAPKQKRVPTILLEQGKSITQNVLTDWMDPDGDDLLLMGARTPAMATRCGPGPDGLLTFQDVGTSLGHKEVAVTGLRRPGPDRGQGGRGRPRQGQPSAEGQRRPRSRRRGAGHGGLPAEKMTWIRPGQAPADPRGQPAGPGRHP